MVFGLLYAMTVATGRRSGAVGLPTRFGRSKRSGELSSLLRAVLTDAKCMGRYLSAVVAVDVLRARVAAIASAEIALDDGAGVDGETAMALHGGTA